MESPYVEAHHQNTWLRVAGHSRLIREKNATQWRYQLADDPTFFLIARWQPVGLASPENFCIGTNPNAKGDDELLAWIAMFGDIKVSPEGIAIITLGSPLTKVPF